VDRVLESKHIAVLHVISVFSIIFDWFTYCCCIIFLWVLEFILYMQPNGHDHGKEENAKSNACVACDFCV